MYAQFFGLKREPFSIAPDPRYLFMSERHREALAHLVYGLNAGGGFVLLTGEIGAGKTTVCRCFLEQIPKRCNVAYIFNPKLTVGELLQSVCDEFHIPLQGLNPGTATVKDYVDPLNAFLLQAHAIGQNNVLIIDEAQNLSPDVLEQLRLLTNLETSKRKLLQIILIGQPELRTMLERPELEQMAQRVIARYHLDALSEPETAQYIRHRLAVAGLPKAALFDRGAVRRVYRLARGVPRRINLLCDRSLLGAYAEGKNVVDRRIVEKAAHEMFGRKAGRPQRLASAHPHPGWLLGAGVAAAALLLGAVIWAVNAGLVHPFREGGAAWNRDAGNVPLAPPPAVATAPAPASTPAPAAPTPAASRPAYAAADGNGSLDGPAPPVPAAATTPPAATADTRPAFRALIREEKDAWRQLAPLWKLSVDAGSDPCTAAQQQQVRCFRSNSSLALIRQLGRPGILTLRDNNNRPAYALLTGLNGQSATLRVEGNTQTVPLAVLAQMWRGDYATFWRAPPGYVSGSLDDASGPLADWLATRLATAQGHPQPVGRQGRDPAALKSRVYAFQVAQGLKADGMAGPTTLMQLNRSLGVDEPRLLTQ
jgi:general secretion pathway protein A